AFEDGPMLEAQPLYADSRTTTEHPGQVDVVIIEGADDETVDLRSAERVSLECGGVELYPLHPVIELERTDTDEGGRPEGAVQKRVEPLLSLVYRRKRRLQ